MIDVTEELQGVTIHELPQEKALEYVDKLAFYYYGGEYRPPGATRNGSSGLSLLETAGKIRSTFPGLVEQAGIASLTSFAVQQAFQREIRRKWSSRQAFANDLVFKNIQRQEMGWQVIEQILNDPDAKDELKLNAIDRLVALEKRQAAMAGYDAPTKVTVMAGSGDDDVFDEKDKDRLLRAKSFTDDFEKSLLGSGDEVVEGEVLP